MLQRRNVNFVAKNLNKKNGFFSDEKEIRH